MDPFFATSVINNSNDSCNPCDTPSFLTLFYSLSHIPYRQTIEYLCRPNAQRADKSNFELYIRYCKCPLRLKKLEGGCEERGDKRIEKDR